MLDRRRTQPGDLIETLDSLEATRRAPFAAAAAFAVMAGGAGFIAFAMSRQPSPEPAIVLAAPADSMMVGRPTPSAPAEKIAVVAPPAPSPAAAPIPEIADDDGAFEAFGGPLRVNPARETIASGPDVAPRVKPPSAPAAIAALPAASPPPVLSFATFWVADETDRPPPFFFESDLDPELAMTERRVAAADGDIAEIPEETRIVLEKGENFVDALRRAGVRAEDRNSAAYAFGAHYNLRRLRPGQEFVLTIAEPHQTLYQSISAKEPPPAFLIALDFRADAETRIALARAHDGSFEANEIATPLTTRIAAIAGRIDGSLYLSAKRQGAPDDVIAGLAQMFAYDVDFQREIFGGDEFEALFEVRFDDSGRMVAAGDIIYGRMKWRGRQKEKGYYRYEPAEAGRAEYFDAAGESARRLLMKTPIDGARLSSGFGTRRHPILGYQKAHKGVDFAAARGTPIKAAGDGVVERAGVWGSFGNYVRIRHAQGYKTAYAHMNSIKVKTGARVRQGDTIGSVGSTGRSTGPHLHYEVHLQDKPVNPQTLKIATGYELSGGQLDAFMKVRDRINEMRTPHVEEDANLVADKGAKGKAL